MASSTTGQTLEKLYIELGLDLSQLQADILAADRTVTENLGRLNREKNTIKLRMAADISGLDKFADASKILEIQERGLNQQLAISKDKLSILEAAYKQVAENQNSTAAAVQKAEQAFERERGEVGRLEQALKSLSAQKISLDTTQFKENISRITAKIQNIRLKAEIDTSQLQGATAAFDKQKVHIAAVTQELELQRQKLIQLREIMYQSAKNTGAESAQTLNIKSNVLQQMQEISKLETKLKELQSTNINLQIKADSLKQTENQIHEGIARINAKVENIRVKTEIDVSKLGAAASEFDKAKVHVQGLTKELELQRQKLVELQKAMYASAKINGIGSTQTTKLHTEIQRQIQDINQLKAKIEELNKIEPPKTNSLLSGYLNIKGDVAGKLNQITSAFNGISQASHSADGAITKSLEIIGAIPHPVGKVVAALASIPLVVKGVENSLLEMSKTAIAGGDASYVMSRGMQLSIADMAKLSTIAKVTGIDINEVNNSLRRFSMQMSKANENNLAAQTLERYGAEIYDETGRLKNALGLAEELGKALKAAEDEGNGAAFRDIVGGKFWSGDFITFLEDFADNVERAKKVVKNGLANPTWAHAIQGEINTLNTQAGQLGGAFSAALMPVVAEIVPKMTEQFGELTKVIAANKENIKFLGEVMALPVRMVYEFTDGLISLSKAIDEAKDKGTTLGKLFQALGEYRDDVAALMNVAPTTALSAIFSPTLGVTDLAIEAYRKEIDEFKKEQAAMEAEAKAKNDERQARAANSRGLNALSMEQQAKLDNKLSSMDGERIKREQETADIIYKLNHSSYENQLHDLENFKNEQLKIIRETEELIKKSTGEDTPLDDERFALFENISAKQLQIEQEKEAKLAEIRERIAAADRTTFENRMIEIENEKDAWIKAGMEKAEAEELAEKQKLEYIKKTEEELSSQLAAVYGTELENRLAQIDKEKQAWRDKCADEVKATELAEQQKVDAQRNAAMSVLKQQAEEYEAYQKGGYGGLRAYKMAQLEKSGVNTDYLYMTPEQLQNFQKASQVAEKSMMPNFMTDHDRAEHYQQMQDWNDWKAARVEADKQQNYAIVNGVKVGLKEALGDSPIEISLGKNGDEEHILKVSPDGDGYSLQDSKYSYDKNGRMTEQETTVRDGTLPSIQEPENYSEISQPLIESFSGLSPAVQSATESLGELPTAVQGVAENLSAIDLSEVNQSFSELSPAVQGATESLGELPTAVQGVSESFSEMNSGFSEVTVKLDDLSRALADFYLPQNQSTEQKQPVNVNTSVQIEEAHAWDYNHIQELAEKVADIIEPRIISAIGGDSNSY